LTAIKKKCLECSGGDKQEVQHCELVHCPLYPFRLGIDPNAPLDLPGSPSPEAVAEAPEPAQAPAEVTKAGQSESRAKKAKAEDQLTLF